ncbi:MAG: tetraacyldisaccharide 4'-kinase [Candidatus Omnitrophica bacterium]|nr:tetraacyldisaccharide 4'-kinase [Candidatus Omnitrophota bacterium]
MKKYCYELMTDVRNGWFDHLLKGVLLVLSWIYDYVVHITQGLYQDHILSVYRAPKPVISVGNITTGGVGKTPFVIWLVKALSDQGIKTVVLSRGYGAGVHGLNDETRMFHEILPEAAIMTGRNRKQSIQKALSQGAVDVFIADDAFQHWPLYRDLDIVAIDAVNPFGNGHLVPRGILREKTEALIRADVFLLTKTDQVASTRPLSQELRAINSRAFIIESRHSPRCFRDVFTGQIYPLDRMKGQKALAFCAIGEPTSFEFTVLQAGLVLGTNLTFADHHQYTSEDMKYVADFAVKENINILVTTHKDAVKINVFRNLLAGLTVLSLDIDLEITEGKDEIIQRIISLQDG